MKNYFLRLFIFILAAVSLLILNSCAEVQLKAISSPPPTAKLRVFVLPISAPFPYPTGTGPWDAYHKIFVERQIRGIEQFLDRTGIYELVPEQDVKEVLGEQKPSFIEMSKNNWALTREAGKALYAEYVYVIERRSEKDGRGGLDYFFTINLINTSSGKLYEASARIDTFDRSNSYRMGEIIRNLYRTVFISAKYDMFGTAIRKSEIISKQDTELAAAPKPEQKTTPPPPETKAQIQTVVPERPVSVPEQKKVAVVPKPEIQPKAPEPKRVPAVPEPEEKTITPPPEIKLPAPEPQKIPDTAIEKPRHDIRGIEKLVIYDLDAPEQYKPVALILTEVLREELFILNRFILVNRENMLDVLREMALQQSGLIDEKQAVKAGKGLAANQIVTGSLGLLGKTYLLNAKRIDVETFVTLGLASTRFVKGEEEDVLGRLPGLAKSLAGMQ